MKFEEVVKKVKELGAIEAYAFDIDRVVPMVDFRDARRFLQAIERLSMNNVIFYITWKAARYKGIGVLTAPTYLYLRYQVREDGGEKKD